MTLTTLNTNMAKYTKVIDDNKTLKNSALKTAIENISNTMNELRLEGLSERKTKKAVKAKILGELNNKDNKAIMRAYNIAFTAHFRGVEINLNLNISTIENLLNYATKTQILEKMNLSQEEVQAFLKTLKTREVITKTFEKKA